MDVENSSFSLIKLNKSHFLLEELGHFMGDRLVQPFKVNESHKLGLDYLSHPLQ